MPTGTVVMFGNEFVSTLFARMIWAPMIGPSELAFWLYSTLPVPKRPPWKYWLFASRMLSPVFTWPPVPLATIVSISAFGSQFEKMQELPVGTPQRLPLKYIVPER